MRKAAVLCARVISCPGTDKRVQANENETNCLRMTSKTGSRTSSRCYRNLLLSRHFNSSLVGETLSFKGGERLRYTRLAHPSPLQTQSSEHKCWGPARFTCGEDLELKTF
jgi:hypothetical protein